MSVAVPVIDRLDLVEKEIYLKAGVRSYHPVEDIYAEIRNLRRTDELLRVVDMPVKAFGNIPKGGGKYTPRYAVFYQGWKVVPEDANHTLTITGEQITDDGQSGEACLYFGDTSPGTSIVVNYYPPAAEIVRDEASLSAIAHMSFNNEIWVDTADGFSIAGFTGDSRLLGNSQFPVNNHADAKTIASAKKIKRLRLSGEQFLTDAIDFSEFSIRGDSAITSILNLDSAAIIGKAEIANVTLRGVLDGEATVRESILDGVQYFNGVINDSSLTVQPIVLGGTATANLFQCYSAVPGGNARPVIDFNHLSTPLAIRDWYGGLELINKSNTEGEVSIDMSSGILYIRSSCTAGSITVRGIGRLVDESGPDCTVKYEGLLDPAYVQRMTYENKVTLDTRSANAGTVYPMGTHNFPVNNFADAKTIAEEKGFGTINVHGNLTLTTGMSVAGYTVLGDGATANMSATFITLEQGYSGSGATFRDCRVSGRQSGETFYFDCIIDNIYNTHCLFKDCALAGPIALSNSSYVEEHLAVYEDCFSLGVLEYDFNNSPMYAAFVDFKGAINLKNMTRPESKFTLYCDSGVITIDSSCTAGEINIFGIVSVVNNSNVVINQVSNIDPKDAAKARKLQANKAVVSPDGLLVTIYDDNGTTPIQMFDISPDKKTRTPR